MAVGSTASSWAVAVVAAALAVGAGAGPASAGSLAAEPGAGPLATVAGPAIPVVSSGPLATVAPAAAVTRLAGATRIETSVAISKASFSPGVPVAYVATADNFPDALSGAPVAVMTGGPVLLTTGPALPPVVATELARLRPWRIVVLGGSGVVPTAVLQSLKAYTTGTVTRLSGATRVGTSG